MKHKIHVSTFLSMFLVAPHMHLCIARSTSSSFIFFSSSGLCGSSARLHLPTVAGVLKSIGDIVFTKCKSIGINICYNILSGYERLCISTYFCNNILSAIFLLHLLKLPLLLSSLCSPLSNLFLF